MASTDPATGQAPAEPPAKQVARTIYVDEATWERIREIGFRARPRRTASQVIRDFITQGLAQESER